MPDKNLRFLQSQEKYRELGHRLGMDRTNNGSIIVKMRMSLGLALTTFAGYLISQNIADKKHSFVWNFPLLLFMFIITKFQIGICKS